MSKITAMVDEDKLAISTAADYIAGLPHNKQADLLTVMERLDVAPTKSQLIKIKQLQ